jgi:formamidopyrimidine-DNA glycosylase
VPELPEVETVRRTIERALLGQRLIDVEVVPDDIVLKGVPAQVVQSTLDKAIVTSVGRKGKYFWLQLDGERFVFAHLGMAGWVREIGEHSIRLREHGKAPLDTPEGRPKFLKMMLTGENSRQIAMTDGRRLARIWLAESPQADVAISKLGPDCLYELPAEVSSIFSRRSAPIKSLLLDQTLLSGIGNWIADEVLYHAGIRPSKPANEVAEAQYAALRDKIQEVVQIATDLGANSEQFPSEWLFHTRWGGSKGDETIAGERLVREQVGGRTTAWVPTKQS